MALQFAKEALALLRMKVFGVADGFVMMGVTFLLECRSVVIDGQTVADQHAGEIFSLNVVQQFTSTPLSNDIEGEQLGSENPQPPAGTSDPPAGLVAMQRGCLAHFCSQDVVLGFYFGSQANKALREPVSADLIGR
jgi:hypothetical protein